MPIQVDAVGFQDHYDHVVYESNDHAPEVIQTVAELKKALLKVTDMDGDFHKIEKINLSNPKGKGLAVWFWIKGHRLFLTYDHDKENKSVVLRKGSSRGKEIGRWNDQNCSEIESFFDLQNILLLVA